MEEVTTKVRLLPSNRAWESGAISPLIIFQRYSSQVFVRGLFGFLKVLQSFKEMKNEVYKFSKVNVLRKGGGSEGLLFSNWRIEPTIFHLYLPL